MGVYFAYSSEILPSERQERQSLAQSESHAATSRTNSVSAGAAVPGKGNSTVTDNTSKNTGTNSKSTGNIDIVVPAFQEDSKTEESGCEKANVSMREYVDMIFKLTDLWDNLECKSDSLKQPLTANDAEAYRPFDDKQ